MKQQGYPKRHGKSWSPTEISVLLGQVKEGAKVGQLAALLERSEFAVECAIAKHCSKLKAEPISSKGLVINGRDYDKILDVAKKLVSNKVVLSAEMYIATIGLSAGF